MNSNFALGFLRIATTVLYYFLIFVAIGFIVAFVVQLSGKGGKDWNMFHQEVKGKDIQEQQVVHSTDGAYNYKPIADKYNIQVEPSSAQGFYTLVVKLSFLLLGIAALYQLKKIFRRSNITDPFRTDLLKRLKILSWLFISSDVLKLLNYFITNSLMSSSFPGEGFQLISDFGDGIINAFIIWVIIVVLERGKQLKEENALTV